MGQPQNAQALQDTQALLDRLFALAIEMSSNYATTQANIAAIQEDIRRLNESVQSSRRDLTASTDATNAAVARLQHVLEEQLRLQAAQHDVLVSIMRDDRSDRRAAELRNEERDNATRSLAVAAVRALWDSGGKYVVYALAALIAFKLAGGEITLPPLTKNG